MLIEFESQRNPTLYYARAEALIQDVLRYSILSIQTKEDLIMEILHEAIQDPEQALQRLEAHLKQR